MPSVYEFAQRSNRGQFGDFFYRRRLSGIGYEDSRSRCERDGAILMIPENFADLVWIGEQFPIERSVWLGINDIEEEGNFVRDDGQPLTYTNWDPESDDPDNWNGITLQYEGANAVSIGQRDLHPEYYFHDSPNRQAYTSICMYNIKPCKYRN